MKINKENVEVLCCECHKSVKLSQTVPTGKVWLFVCESPCQDVYIAKLERGNNDGKTSVQVQ